MVTSRILFTAKQKDELWERWKNGQSVLAISRALERRNKTGVQRIVALNGGIAPAPRCRAVAALKLEEREEISRGIAAGRSVRRIARGLKRSPSTISREIRRNGGSQTYRANRAERSAWERALRPKPCRLALHGELRWRVAQKLALQWSPEQISGWLKQQFPTDRDMRISHEAIYRSLFVQTRGVLKKELTRSEPIRDSEEILLVDRIQQCNHRPLDDLVLQGGDGQRALPTVRLGNVDPS